MKHKLLLFLLFCLPLSAWAGNASNVRVRQQDKDIVITYDLKSASTVRLLMSVNNGAFKTVKATEGAIGKHVHAGKNLTITWHPLQEQEKFIASNVRFKVEAYSSYEAYALWESPYASFIHTYILGQYAYAFTPQRSCGFVFGQNYYCLGWFVDMRSNWNFAHFGGPKDGNMYPKADESGAVPSEDWEYPFYSGKTESTLFTAHAGFSWLFGPDENRFNTVGFYIGLGYGVRRVALETTDGTWVEYSPTTYNGFSGNIGIIGSVFGLTLRAGVNTINFKYMEIEGAIGWMF